MVEIDHLAHQERGHRSPGTTLSAGRRDVVQSVDRALTVLEVVAGCEDELSLAEISQRAGLNVSTCHHLVSTLLTRKYLARGTGRGAYTLGPQFFALSGAVNRQADLSRRAQPFLDELNRVTGEAVHLAVLHGNELVTLVKREALHALRVDAGSVGKSAACHATATGKALLAWLAEEEVLGILDRQGMKAFTPRTIVDPKVLIEELRAVRENGYAMDREEFQPHVVCVGVPVRGHDGSVIAAISVSSPTMRADDDHLALVRREVLAIARKLSSSAACTSMGSDGARR